MAFRRCLLLHLSNFGLSQPKSMRVVAHHSGGYHQTAKQIQTADAPRRQLNNSGQMAVCVLLFWMTGLKAATVLRRVTPRIEEVQRAHTHSLAEEPHPFPMNSTEADTALVCSPLGRPVVAKTYNFQESITRVATLAGVAVTIMNGHLSHGCPTQRAL